MKNVIYIIVDALCYNSIERNIGNAKVMPFLNSLSDKALSFTNMYTQAPYTEASLVALLSGENTLDSGGYLFGNGTTNSSIFHDYVQNGYKTIFSYSPYVYSKAYLKDVTEYYYTRLYSMGPLFLYRLDYYFNKWKDNLITSDEIMVCALLLEESFETWVLQCEQFINNDREIKLLEDWISDKEKIEQTLQKVLDEKSIFEKDKEQYVFNMFESWENNKLRNLNKEYINRADFPWRKDVSLTEYKEKFKMYQEKYHKIIKKDFIDVDYALGMVARNKDGVRDAKNTLRAYKRYYESSELANYLDNITEDAKVEVSMRRAFDVYYEDIKRYDDLNQNFFAHIHMQEFHLPSVFHTLDTNDAMVVKEDLDKAINLLEKMDSSYRGNIIADLSANYCDRQIERFFNMLKETLKNDFIFVVTADHGYPSYEQPPRPIVYNQTYTEAFHVPFVLYDGSDADTKEQLYSDIDAIDFMKARAGIISEKDIETRDYILCEYGGPGCPDISEKEIWYTYIDKKQRVSVQAKLDDDITSEKVVAIFNVEKDPKQLKDLYHIKRKSPEVEKVLSIIHNRHLELRGKYQKEKFVKKQLEIVMRT